MRSEAFQPPEWYSPLQAARYHGVPMWMLIEQSIWYEDIAHMAMEAEAEAQKIMAAHS